MQTLGLTANTTEINGKLCLELAITARNNEWNVFTYYRHHAFISNDKQEHGEIIYLFVKIAKAISNDTENTWNWYNVWKLTEKLIDNWYISEKLGGSINLD